MHHRSLYPPIPDIPPQNVHNVMFNRPDQQNWPDYQLHVDASTGASQSFQDFLEIVRDGATTMGSEVHFGGLGIRAENRELVAILSENSMDVISLFHSLLVMTVPFVIISSYSTPFEFQHAFNVVGPTRLFASPILLPLALTSGLPDDRVYVLGGHVPGRTSYMDLVERARHHGIPRLPVRPAERNTLAYLVFSSGTTGPPKAVMISHGNLIDSLFQFFVMSAEAPSVPTPLIANDLGSAKVFLSVLPMHHTSGLHLTSFKRFLTPTTIVLLSKWNADVFFDCIPKYRVTSICLVPSLVHQVVHHSKFSATDFSTVQFLSYGAAYLPNSLAKQLCSRFPGVDRMNAGYGMSECTFCVSVHPAPGSLGGHAKIVPESVGILLPGMEARVVREDGTLASINEPGELYVRSGSVALGYWDNQKATDETFKDGWLRTGDRMRIDADGVLYFEDRVKDTLKVSGMQLSPTEVEETLLQHPQNLIIDATVAGVSGGRTDDEKIPRAWVVLSPKGQELGTAEVVRRLDEWIRETLNRYKWLRGGIAVVNQIPKSHTGKVLRRALVDEYERLRSRTPATVKL